MKWLKEKKLGQALMALLMHIITLLHVALQKDYLHSLFVIAVVVVVEHEVKSIIKKKKYSL